MILDNNKNRVFKIYPIKFSCIYLDQSQIKCIEILNFFFTFIQFLQIIVSYRKRMPTVSRSHLFVKRLDYFSPLFFFQELFSKMAKIFFSFLKGGRIEFLIPIIQRNVCKHCPQIKHNNQFINVVVYQLIKLTILLDLTIFNLITFRLQLCILSPLANKNMVPSQLSKKKT